MQYVVQEIEWMLSDAPSIPGIFTADTDSGL